MSDHVMGRDSVGDGLTDMLKFCWNTKSLAFGKDGMTMSKRWEADCTQSVVVFVAVLLIGGTFAIMWFMKLCTICCGTKAAEEPAAAPAGQGKKAKKKKNKANKAAAAPAPEPAAAAAEGGGKNKKKKKNKAAQPAAEPEAEDSDDGKETAEERYEREDAEHAARMKEQFNAPAPAAGKKKKKKGGGGGGSGGGGGDGGGSGGGGGGGSGGGLTAAQQADMDAGWEVEGAKKKKQGGKKKSAAGNPNADPNAVTKDSSKYHAILTTT